MLNQTYTATPHTKEPIMTARKMFLEGFTHYKTVSVAAAALATGMVLTSLYATAKNAEQVAAAAYDKEHRIEVIATRLVATKTTTAVASLGSDTLIR
jgi:hypothetical protein